MKSQKTFLLVVAAALCTTVCVQAENESSLQFVTNDTSLQWITGNPGESVLTHGPVFPSYAASFNLQGRRILPDFRSPDVIQKILSNPEGKQLSKKQVEFINSGLYFLQNGDISWEHPNCYPFRIYGVSKEDTEMTARAFLKYFTEQALCAEPLKMAMSVLQEQLPRYKTKLSKLTQDNDNLSAELKEQLRRDACSSIDEAQNQVADLNAKFMALNVESTGIKAQLKEINYIILSKAEPDKNKELRAKLEEKIHDLNIELAGMEAKTRESNMQIDRIRQTIGMNNKLKNINTEMELVKNEIMQIERAIELLDVQMAKPEMMSPVILKNKIIISPVKKD